MFRLGCMVRFSSLLVCCFLCVGISVSCVAQDPQSSDQPSVASSADQPDRRQRIEFQSTRDGSTQAAYLIVPRQAVAGKPLPMVISLHSWSADMQQRNTALEELVYQRGWFYLFPNFRGPNQTTAALGSPLAQQDILDAVESVCASHSVDRTNLFLTGNSGGGHMTMMMAGLYPHRWTAASAWVGISDIAAWHSRHTGKRYGNMMEKCCGGAPGDSAVVDEQYRLRSPLTHLAEAKDLPIDIAAGVHDGHRGSVPVKHSIDAFNLLAVANQALPVSPEEIKQISRKTGRLDQPRAGDVGFDKTFGRDYYLRRTAGRARLTIFEGAHEGIATAAMAWFEKHQR